MGYDFGESIKNILDISDSVDEETIKKVVRGLSFFLTKTNEDYYYTETYLNDNVNYYIAFIKRLQQRNKFADELFKSIKKNLGNNPLQIEINIDEIWCISKSYDTEWKLKHMDNETVSFIKEPKVHITYKLSLKNSVSAINRYEEYSIDKNIIDKVIGKIKSFCNIFLENGDSKNGIETKDFAEQIV